MKIKDIIKNPKLLKRIYPNQDFHPEDPDKILLGETDYYEKLGELVEESPIHIPRSK